MYLLAIDPGKHNGLARWNWETAELTHNWELEYDAMCKFLDNLKWDLHAIVIEDYIIDGRKNHGSRGDTIKIIALAESAGRRLKIPVIRQQPALRMQAAKWAEIKVPKGHMPDTMSAMLHGIVYLRRQGKYVTPLEKRSLNGTY